MGFLLDLQHFKEFLVGATHGPAKPTPSQTRQQGHSSSMQPTPSCLTSRALAAMLQVCMQKWGSTMRPSKSSLPQWGVKGNPLGTTPQELHLAARLMPCQSRGILQDTG